MFARILLFLTVLPLLELFILIKIGARIGALNTLLLIVLTVALGVFLVRLEGLRTLRQIQSCLEQGRIPTEELIDGLLIFIAGILLLAPGVLTDFAALVLLVPYSRMHFKRWLRRRFDRMVSSGGLRLHYYNEPRRF